MAAKGVKTGKSGNMKAGKITDQNPKDIVRVKSPNAKDPSQSMNWWVEPKETIAAAVQAVVDKIENAQGTRTRSFVRFARMYGNYEALGYSQLINLVGNSESVDNRMRLNIIQSVIDAAAAKIAKDRPKPYFITSGADFFTRLRAEDITKFVAGIFQQNKFYDLADTCFRDAELFGTGAVQWMIKDDKVVCEWVPTIELRVDDYDGMKKKPRSIHRTKLVSKEVLIAEHPELEDKLKMMGASDYVRSLPSPTLSVVEMLRVIESWHLPAKKDKKDGKHTLIVNDLVLIDEGYKKDYFPIVPFRWYSKPLGWYGRSITEEIYAIQIEINKLLWTAQNCFELVGIPLIFVENASQVSEDVLLSNFVARMIPYHGTEPHIVTPEPLPTQFFQHLNNHIQWAFQIVGLSQTSATSMNQLGPDASGAAIRELVDIETTRFAQVGKNWEQFFCRNAEIVVDMAKDLYAQDREFSVSYTYKKEIQKIAWKDCEIEDDFSVKCDPVSALPDSVAGRLQTISEYINQGWINPDRGMELMQLDPDLEHEVDLRTAALRNVDDKLTKMVKDGVYIHPETDYMTPQNEQEALDVSIAVYNLLVLQKCPEDRLQLVRDWIKELVTAVHASMPPAPPPGMPGPPGAPPQPPGVPQQ